MLARYRETHPALKQLIFRPGTVLGRTARNQITALFEKPILLGLRGTASPFVLVWDKDLVACIMKGIKEGKAGIYNVAGDGALTMKEMAGIMAKPYLSVPVWLVRTALMILKAARMTQYGPEQVNFLRYRPVLDNRRLKEAFGYVPEKTTREVFHYYLETRGAADKQNSGRS
jgi:UDP-glucose 4-epimerase